MKQIRTLTIIMLATCAAAATFAPAAGAADQGIKVEKAVAATSVQNLEPLGTNTEFPTSLGTVYCWTKISAKTVPAKIKHVWYLGDKKVFEYPLDVKFHSARTWSSKSVRPGIWRVDVTDDAGNVLASVEFTVK